jgi:hypothetical protein
VDAARRYPLALNANIRDIRKTAISRHLVGPDSDWDGPVIVKTNLNSAGVPEKLFRRHGRWDRTFFRLRERKYRIYQSLSDVPEQTFQNRRLVVEKFLPERSGDSYCLRSYNFLGDVGDCHLLYSDDPLVSGHTIKHMEQVSIHPAMLARRKELGFDYGKFDYVERDGEAILLDANKTPGQFHAPELTRRRAAGIHSFFSR